MHFLVNYPIVKRSSRVRSLLMVIGLFLSNSLLASGGSYFGIGYHTGNYNEFNIPKADLGGANLKYGRYVADNIAIEANFLVGTSDDTVTVSVFDTFTVDIDIELERALSLFVKGDVPLSESINFYSLLGYSKTKLKASNRFSEVSLNEGNFSYGFGFEASVSDDILIYGEYVSYLNEEAYDYDGFNLAIRKSF